MTRLRTLLGRLGAAIRAALGVNEIVLFVALGLIAAGMWLVWRPGAFLVPGLVLLWLALPSRAPFVFSAPPPEPPAKPSSPATRRRV